MRRLVVGLVALLLLPLGVAGLPVATAATRTTVTAQPATTWQTNGTVWALAYAGGVVFAGGDFTSVRPPGAAAGTADVPRQNLAAFDASTGALLETFAGHAFDAEVRALATSPDGKVVYAGGN